MSKWHAVARLILFGFAMTCASAWADVLCQRDGTVLFGRIIQQSDAEIVFRERVNADNYIERRIATGDVSSLIRTIDESRLEQLHPGDPLGYLQVAEELALMRRDPEAQSLAIRLYLIAASLTRGLDRNHCLRALVQLARSPHERRSLCELAFLLDRSAPPSILAEPPAPPGPPTTGESLAETIQAVRRARQGDAASLSELLQRESSRALLQRLAAICPVEQLRRVTTAPPRTLEELQSLVRLEYALVCMAGARTGPLAAESWKWDAVDESVADWEPPRLSNVTEFDPEQNVFRDGEWKAERAHR